MKRRDWTRGYATDEERMLDIDRQRRFIEMQMRVKPAKSDHPKPRVLRPDQVEARIK